MAARKAKTEMDSDDTRRKMDGTKIMGKQWLQEKLVQANWWRVFVENKALAFKLPRSCMTFFWAGSLKSSHVKSII